MKFMLLVSVLIFSEVKGQAFAPASLVESPFVQAGQLISGYCNSTLRANKKYCNGLSGDELCSADGFHWCDGTGTSGITYPCADELGEYCNEPNGGDARCQKTPAKDCKEMVQEPFTCTGNGVFPDPTNCSFFYYCLLDDTSKKYTFEKYECESGYVFDPSFPNSYYCRRASQNYCTTAACNGATKNVLLTYTWFPKTKGQFAATCRGSLPPVVHRCDPGFEPDLTTTAPIECSYVCKGSERAANSDDPTKYYQCVYNGSKYVPQPKKCFPSQTFNPKSKVCEVSPTQPPAQTTTTLSTQSTTTPTTQLTTSTSEATVSTTESTISSSETTTPTIQSATSTSEATVSTTESTISSSETTTPTIQSATPTSNLTPEPLITFPYIP